MRSTYYISLLLMSCIFFWGCNEEDLPKQPLEEVSVSLNLSIEQSNLPTVRSVTTDYSNSISDCWLFQFDQNGRIIGAPQYYTSSSFNHISLYKGNSHTIVALVNTHEPNKVWRISTKNKLSQVTKDIHSETDCYNNSYHDVMMNGQSNVVNVNNQTQQINVTLTRNIAQYQVEIHTYNNIYVEGVFMANVPSRIRYFNSSPISQSIYPADRWVNLTYSQERLPYNRKVTFYLPPNKRGKSDSYYQDEKGSNAPEKATVLYIYISKDNLKYVIKIYPGANRYNDFNIYPNKIYRTNLTIQSLTYAEDDARVRIPIEKVEHDIKPWEDGGILE